MHTTNKLVGLFLKVFRRIRLRGLILRVLFPFKIAPGQLKSFLWPILPIRTHNRHQELTLLRSEDRLDATSAHLVRIAGESALVAYDTRLDLLESRICAKQDLRGIASLLKTNWSASQWPGEHYCYLSAVCNVIQAKSVIEIGTFWGFGTLALQHGVGQRNGSVVTFDILPWDSFPETVLQAGDFGPPLQQVTADLQQAAVFEANKALFENADLIFMDAAKDGIMERTFLAHFERCRFKPGALLVIDDIRLWNMLDIWDGIQRPKLDVTSFGHYTGTGFVQLGSNK